MKLSATHIAKWLWWHFHSSRRNNIYELNWNVQKNKVTLMHRFEIPIESDSLFFRAFLLLISNLPFPVLSSQFSEREFLKPFIHQVIYNAMKTSILSTREKKWNSRENHHEENVQCWTLVLSSNSDGGDSDGGSDGGAQRNAGRCNKANPLIIKL